MAFVDGPVALSTGRDSNGLRCFATPWMAVMGFRLEARRVTLGGFPAQPGAA